MRIGFCSKVCAPLPPPSPPPPPPPPLLVYMLCDAVCCVYIPSVLTLMLCTYCVIQYCVDVDVVYILCDTILC